MADVFRGSESTLGRKVARSHLTARFAKFSADRVGAENLGIGMVVGVIDANGRRVVACGSLAKNDGRRLDGDTVFEIGSMTKVFTCLLLMDMTRRGEVALADPVSKYLPSGVKVPVGNNRKITLADLSTQSSGLPRMPTNFTAKDDTNPYADYSVQQMYDFLSGYQLTRDIGSQYEYSNLGVGLLGHALTLRAGMSYEALVRSRICDPLGMANTGITLTPEMKARLAVGHSPSLAAVANLDIPTLAGAGALRSTASDMLKFLANLGYVKTPSAQAMADEVSIRHPTGAPDLQIAFIFCIYSVAYIVLLTYTAPWQFYNAREERSSMVAVTTSDKSTRIEEKLRRELGSHVLQLIEEERTEDIVLNPDGSLWVYRLGEGFVQVGEMSEEQAYSAVGTIASSRQTVVNHDHLILETELPLNGARFEAIVPPVARRPIFAIRLRPRRIFTLDDYKSAGILTDKNDPLNGGAGHKGRFAESVQGLDHTEILKRAVGARMNILAVGRCAAGKTTLANAVLDMVAKATPNDRVVTVEDTIELQCGVENFVDLHAIGKVSLDDCVRACLRLRPTRIIVGEVRGREALELLKGWATGHPGGVATIHGEGALAGLVQLENYVAEATSAPKQILISETIHLVVYVDLEPKVPAGRKVREIAVVTGCENGRYVLAYV